MNYILYLIILLVSLQNGFCQKNIYKFPVLWQTHSLKTGTSGPGQAYQHYYYNNYYLPGDSTEINDTIYQRLYHSYDTVFNVQKIEFFKYLLVINNKVYIGDSFQDLQLVLDYNLNIADSFCFNAENPFWLKVNSVDSVMIGGSKRKRITFDSLPNRQALIWIEGLGDITYGQHFSNYQTLIQWSFFYQELDCYSENNSILWGTNCRTTSISNYISDESHYFVYPNPTNGKFWILSEENSNKQIDVYNSLGSLLLTKKTIGQDEIDITDFKKGIYFIKIGDNKRVFKIIKK
jgi:hypothetical protein